MDFPPRRYLRWPYAAIASLMKRHSFFDFDRETNDHVVPKSFDMWWNQFVIGKNIGPYWPVHPTSKVYNWRNVGLGVDSAPGFMPGCYIQAFDSITVGNYVRVAPNVGIISGNHDIHDGRKHITRPVRIGDYSWLAMNSVILPGVTLGPFTVVAANSVVTQSFPDGYVVLAGSPAQPVKDINPADCVRYGNENKYIGYLKAAKFPAWAEKNLFPPHGNFS